MIILYFIAIFISLAAWIGLYKILESAEEIKRKEQWTKTDKLKFKASIFVFCIAILTPYLNLILAILGLFFLVIAIFDKDLR